MARLSITIDVSGWTVHELQEAVRDIDALDDEIPIAADNVDVKDILTYMFDGQLGLDHVIVEQTMQDW